MCGIAGAFGHTRVQERLSAMVGAQHHRGPDDNDVYVSPEGNAGLGHNRLSIIDLSRAGHQPMSNSDETMWIAFNGEIYNYIELRKELKDYPFRTGTDTEIILAAYERWQEQCLDKFIGMFSFLIWDTRRNRLFAARDRFGVKPLYWHGGDHLLVASEINAIRAGGAVTDVDHQTWATYLATGLYDHSERTFWRDIRSVPAGHYMTWQDGKLDIRCWYDVADRVGPDYDERPQRDVEDEYLALVLDSVALRFRSDVPVGINLSGGLDSSLLLAIVHTLRREQRDLRVFTFVTGDERYDELPWVEQMLAHTPYQLVACSIAPADVPQLAESVQSMQDQPVGGLPTLAYARLHEIARSLGIVVLLDGQGMDEQWAGYDYYHTDGPAALVQGSSKSGPTRRDCLVPEFARLAEEWHAPSPFPDRLRNLQYRDIRYTKIPRALRFNDGISMRVSTELREPFLDHRLVELALRQPPERKLRNGSGKYLLRQLASQMVPQSVVASPKRPMQTPQREWLRGPLSGWANDYIQHAIAGRGESWFDRVAVQRAWGDYRSGASDNSFYVWQWIAVAMITQKRITRAA